MLSELRWEERGVSLQSDTLHIELVREGRTNTSQYKITVGPELTLTTQKKLYIVLGFLL